VPPLALPPLLLERTRRVVPLTLPAEIQWSELPLRAFVPRKEGEHAPDEALDASAAATREVA